MRAKLKAIVQADRHLDSGRLAHIERLLSEIGVDFDVSVGAHGRDWQLDWSLRGPVSVCFRGRSKERSKSGMLK